MDPLFHAGTYYVQEASSMFLEVLLRKWLDLSCPLRVLDLCAAPGGKSTLIQSLLGSTSLLVSNEPRAERAAILADNLCRWGAANTLVTRNEPEDFKFLPGYFDLVLVDAPCSGSGMFRKEPISLSQWSEDLVQSCSQTQRRILASIWPALKTGGILIYGTCSYSSQENEEILDWLLGAFEAKTCDLDPDPAWGILTVISPKRGAKGFRFYPFRLQGEGLFLAGVQKKGGSGDPSLPRRRSRPYAPGPRSALDPWLAGAGDLEYRLLNKQGILFPRSRFADLDLLEQGLRIRQAGIKTGDWKAGQLVPSHSLAMSGLLNPELSQYSLGPEDALIYLKRGIPRVTPGGKGWQLAVYEGFPLGWLKVLESRINNYYPKQWRIPDQWIGSPPSG